LAREFHPLSNGGHGFGIKPTCGIEELSRLFVVAKNLDHTLVATRLRIMGNDAIFEDRIIWGLYVALCYKQIVILGRHVDNDIHRKEIIAKTSKSLLTVRLRESPLTSELISIFHFYVFCYAVLTMLDGFHYRCDRFFLREWLQLE